MLVDCPHPIRRMLRDASRTAGLTPALDLDRVSGVALTHLHADHACGLEDFGFYSKLALGRRGVVACRGEVAEELWGGLLSAGMGRFRGSFDGEYRRFGLEDYFDVRLVEPEAPIRVGGFELECRAASHSLPATAFKIRAGGRTLGVSGDTRFDPELLDWLGDADLIVHEATTHDPPGFHTPLRDLAGLPADLRGRMRLVHYPDDFDAARSPIAALREGDWLEV